MSEIENGEIPEKLIDIEAVFASKNPQLLKFIPGFVLSYLKRITHQDEVNGYIYRNRHLSGLPFVEAILKEFGVKVEVIDKSNASSLQHLATGRFIIAANHPLGGLDGMALMHAIGKIRTDIVFPVNDLLMNVPGLRPLFIPINKHGKNSENAKLIDQTFASDKLVLYFPAGLVSRKMSGKKKTEASPPASSISPSTTPPQTGRDSSGIQHPASSIRDLEWKNTFIKKAKKYQRDVIPVFISGRNSEWFYNLARWRKRLGIKANIEMLYLVDEMTRQLGKTITLVVGEVIPWSTFDKSKTESQWAEWVKELVYGLGK